MSLYYLINTWKCFNFPGYKICIWILIVLYTINLPHLRTDSNAYIPQIKFNNDMQRPKLLVLYILLKTVF